MSYGPFEPWDSAASYSAGNRVTFGGYIYEAMTAISAGDNPRTATYSLLGGTFRKWRVWDYPATYIMARLRGLPDAAFADEFGVASPMPVEVRTICVRNFYISAGDPVYDLFTLPTSYSEAGYGMPQGMDTNWEQPSLWDPIYAPSAAMYEDGAPKAYDNDLGGGSALYFQPNTVAAQILYDLNGGFNEAYLAPAWDDETQGQMISCYQTFERNYNFALMNTSPYSGDGTSTPAFQDNWQAAREWTGYDQVYFIKDTSPDLDDDT